MCLVDQMENEDGETETECGEAELRQKVEALKQELRECRAELSKLQKQLNQSERLQKSTESYNEDLRKQVGEYRYYFITHLSHFLFYLYKSGVIQILLCLSYQLNKYTWPVLYQVDKLSAEIHERKKKEKEKVDRETQTEEQVWTETGVLHVQQTSSNCFHHFTFLHRN